MAKGTFIDTPDQFNQFLAQVGDPAPDTWNGRRPTTTRIVKD